MNYQEAVEIAEMCRPDEFGASYPPTNPAILLEAARVIYLEVGGNSKPMRTVIAWLVHTMCITLYTRRSIEMKYWYGLIVNGAVVVVRPFLENPDVSDFEYAIWPEDKYEIVWMGLHWTAADGHNHVL